MTTRPVLGFGTALVDQHASGVDPREFAAGLLCHTAELRATSDWLDQPLGALPRWRAMLRFAAACGALTMTRQGSFAGLPRGAEVLAFVEKQA